MTVSRGMRWVGSILLALPVPTLFRQCWPRRRQPGDLFDGNHRDCPAATRLRHGGIADPTLSRNTEEQDEVHAAWPVANPGNRCPGADALVVIPEDNDGVPVAKSMSLGTGGYALL